MNHATRHPGGPGRDLDLSTSTTRQVQDYLGWARREYLTRWGRPMRDDDPLFPDWEAPSPGFMSPARIEAEMVAAMELADVDGALIYAYQQSGVLLTESNADRVDPSAAEEWYAAIARYDALHART